MRALQSSHGIWNVLQYVGHGNDMERLVGLDIHDAGVQCPISGFLETPYHFLPQIESGRLEAEFRCGENQASRSATNVHPGKRSVKQGLSVGQNLKDPFDYWSPDESLLVPGLLRQWGLIRPAEQHAQPGVGVKAVCKDVSAAIAAKPSQAFRQRRAPKRMSGAIGGGQQTEFGDTTNRAGRIWRSIGYGCFCKQDEAPSENTHGRWVNLQQARRVPMEPQQGCHVVGRQILWNQSGRRAYPDRRRLAIAQH